MFSIPITTVVADLTDHILGRSRARPFINEDGTRTEPGVAFTFDLSLAVYSPRQIEQRKVFWIVVAGYKVFVAATKISYSGSYLRDNLHWENTCNHDSCWRTDGLHRPIADEFFKMAQAINAELDDEVAPAEMSQHVSFYNGSAAPFTRVDVTWTTDKEKDGLSGYWKRLVKVEPAKGA